MADIDLRNLPADQFVLHFGGRPNEVDAFTFSNSLVAFAGALQEINRQTSPGTSVDISIEGVGPGSFRAKISTKLKSLSGLWSGVSKPLLIGILASYIYEKTLGPSPVVINVDESMVTIQSADGRIIIPRSVYDARQKIAQPQQIERHISRAFAVMENDPSVTEFGLTAALTDPSGNMPIPREKFTLLTAPPQARVDDGRRHRDEQARVTVIKAVLQRGNRKWEFVWQGGIRISAPILDQTFFDRMASGEFRFGQGDEFDVMLRIHQRYDDINGIFINECYEIINVFAVMRRERQTEFLRH
jgi:hypothetical protein